jgi:glycosyltransferase involved in cell wall biosynthesis
MQQIIVRPLTIDLTMNLANRTAVYDIGHELHAIAHPEFARYWRILISGTIPFARGPKISLLGKAVARAVFWEVMKPWTGFWPRGEGSVLFVDPLFCAKTRLKSSDIVLCHDVAPVSNPEYYHEGAGDSYAIAYKRIQEAKPALVFVSDFTRRAFLKLFPANYPMTEVIPLYFKSTLANAKPGPARERPYFLMVGSMECRKNVRAAFDAYRRSGLYEKGVDLLIVGPRGNASAELQPVIEATPGIEHLGYLSDQQLATFYKHATALFFPSLLEGFGVPALEAPQAGVLPIVSRGTVLEEIVGPDGVFVDPTSIDDMARSLNEVVAMPAVEKASRLEAIRAHQMQFSLENFRARWGALVAKLQ